MKGGDMTSASEIYDLFMMQVTDYRLSTLFSVSEEDFETFLEAWLIFAYTEFSHAGIDFTYDPETHSFDKSLTLEEKTIMATLMAKQWLTKVVNDITQMNLHIGDRDFKVASEAMNLREKSNYLITAKETCSQLLSDYAYKHNDWDNWFLQVFS